MKKGIAGGMNRIIVLLALFVAVPTFAEEISWTWAPTWADGTAVSAEDQAKMTAYLRISKVGNSTAKTYFGETRNGVSTWTDNIMARSNELAVTNAVPGWTTLKAWDNVNVTLSAAFIGSDGVERDSAESPAYLYMIRGPAAFAAISANPVAIVRGSCSTLTWIATDSMTASIDQGIGPVPLTGNRQVCPTSDTIYKISATNPGGTTTSTAQIAVTLPVQPGCNSPINMTIKP